MRGVAVLVVVAGCGRVAFDARPDDAPAAAPDAVVDGDAPSGDGLPALATCIDETFASATGWIEADGKWNLTAGAGPDGSPAFVTGNLENATTHPSLMGLSAVRVSFDFKLDSPNGDFMLLLKTPTSGVQTADGYVALLYPIGGDSSPEGIARVDAGVYTMLAPRPESLTQGTWYRVTFSRLADSSLQLELDGVLILSTPAQTQYPPPFDFMLRMFASGAIDNVHAECAR